MHALRVAFLTASLVSLNACTPEDIAPASPVARPGPHVVPTLPTLPASVVDAPINYAIGPLLRALEDAVPRRFGDMSQRRNIGGNTRRQVAYAAVRTPFRVTFEDQQVALETTLSYQARGWYRAPLSPDVSASCGTGDTMPRVTVRLVTTLSLTKEWQIASHSRVASVKPTTETRRDQCTVTFLNINVTDHVVGAITGTVARHLPAVDRRVARFDMRSRMVRWFGLLQRNIRVTDSLWLQLNPEHVGVGVKAVELVDSTLVIPVRLTAHPQLISGLAPPRTIVALPPLGEPLKDVGDSARLHIEGLLDYTDATAILQRELGGRRISRFGRYITIDSIRIYPLTDGRVVLALRVGGGVRGDVFLVGTPQIDFASRALVVPDLDFDVSTNDALVRGLTWLKKGDLVMRLRNTARFPLDKVLEETRQRVEGALNRDLTTGVHLSGSVRAGRLVDAIVHPHWLVIRAEAAGTLALDVDRPIRGKPKPKATAAP